MRDQRSPTQDGGEDTGGADVAGRIARQLRDSPDTPAMEWLGQWWTRGQLTGFGDALTEWLDTAGYPRDAAVGFVARNRPTHVAALAGLVCGRRAISMVYAFQSAEALAADIRGGGLGVLLIDEQDWTTPVAEVVSAAGATALLLAATPEGGFHLEGPGVAPADVRRLPGPGIEILSSGTTGPPKRIFHGVDMLFRSLQSGPQGLPESARTELVFWPLGGIGGNLQLAAALLKCASFVLLEKFTVEGFVDAVKRHRMSQAGLTPTMVRMIYDADVAPEDLASLAAFSGGSGPLDPDLQEKMESRYAKPVIWALGATEFCGTVLAWTLDLHREFGVQKRGSVGRPLPGCQVRVADAQTGAVMRPGEVGRMEVRVERMGLDWIATTDLAMIDEDGFVFHRGRSDGAIIRGGFKIVPERVCEALRLHPAVAEAAVIGVADDRLGHVPVAVVERREGLAATAKELDMHLRARLAAPQIPVRYVLVDRLPYTASTKVDLRAARVLAEAPV